MFLCLLYFSAKLMILKLAKLVDEQNVRANIENEDTNVDDIGADMLCNNCLLYTSDAADE